MASRPTDQVEFHGAAARRDIDRQVERILNHPLFRLSKRLPVFLQYIVNLALGPDGHNPPKERILGVEVFGRRPDYDTNSDPIVRVTATELRKKLAQYYYEDGHNDEIRIELPQGSYLPIFRRSVAEHKEEQAAEHSAEEASAAEQIAVVESAHTAAEPADATAAAEAARAEQAASARRSSSANWWRLTTLLLFFAFLILAVAVLFPAALQRFTPLGSFWTRFVGNSNRVLIVMPVIGSTSHHGTDAIAEGALSVQPNLSLEDTNIAARVASQLEKQNAHYTLTSSSEATFDELRTSPFVLIGALDNVWTMRITRDLPFTFETTPDGLTGQIVDAGSGGRKRWSLDITTPHTRITRDYGIVAFYNNRLTGEPVIVIAGISSQGTQAAGELLTSADAFRTIHSAVGSSRNFELVIETEAIDGHAGPPQIVASKSW